ncbi:MAG: 50S ribosomal protein L11 methyltransferase [Desulfobacterales bacterium]|nr:50S ribosomal protein L11 methyltransferase [Desulfobacterales bacterium]
MLPAANSNPVKAASPTVRMTSSMGYRAPYTHLYIYYLKGLAGPAETAFDARFIGNWEEEGYSFLFFSEPADNAVRCFLRARSDLELCDRFEMTYDDWQGGRFEGLRAGRLVIYPAWENQAVGAAEDDIVMRLDPGVVFGAGTHPTTQDCLTALEMLSADDPGGTLLDLGTGTGVLAVAAARLGWQRVLAVDFNRLAVKTADYNVKLNALAGRVLAVHGRAEQLVACPAATVVANIHYDVLGPMIRTKAFDHHRNWILSGLLRSQAREVEIFLVKAGMAIRRRWSRDNTWFTYWTTRRKRL